MSNQYYTHGSYPTPNAPGSSAQMRAELDLITVGFNKLPALSGNANKVITVNAGATALEAVTGLTGLTLTGSTINSTTIGLTTPAAGSFTTLAASGGYTGTVTGNVTGNLTGNVTGNVTSTGASSFSSVTITGGTINNVAIGASTAQTVRGTTITATVGFAGDLTGNVAGNVTGDVTGNVTGNLTGAVAGNVTGDLTGNVTAASGTSTFNNVTINGTLDMNSATGSTITGLSAPTGDTDAANKAYVDNLVQGLDAKASCTVATTGNITLSGTQTIDGIAVTAGQRVLVKDQSNAAENGIYVAAAGAWARAADANTWDELVHAFSFVESGTNGGNNGYLCTIAAGGTLGSTAVTWVQFSGAGQITAGAGLTKTGNTINVGTASSGRIVVNADDIDLAATAITPGTYKSLTIDAYGRATAGTNPTTISGYGIVDAYTIAEIDSLFGSTTAAATSAANAATSATAASNSASSASSSASSASGSASSATASASAAAASFDSFDDRYLGAKASNPSVDNDGDQLIAGALYFNTVTNLMMVYTGAIWKVAASAVNGTSERQVYTATAGQTTFAIVYDVGFVDVYQNGSKLTVGVDFAATNGTNIVLATGATVGDIIDIVAYGAFEVANALALTGGTMSGDITFAVTQTFPNAGISYTRYTANVTVTDKQGVIADTTAGAFTVTLPATPSVGFQVVIADGGDWGTNNLTVGRNGSTIEGVAEDLTLDIQGAAVTLIYDGTTWEVYAQIGGNGGTAVTLTGTQTLTNKTIAFADNTLTGVASTSTAQTLTNKTLTDPAIVGTITEDIYTISDGAAFEIDPGNGSIQLITLGANRTPKATNFAAGEAVTMMVDDGTAYTITWTDATFGGSGVVWKTDSGSAPTLNTAGYTVIVLWKVSTQVYGARVGNN